MALKHLPSYISFLPPHLRKKAKEGFIYFSSAIPLAGVAGTVLVDTVAIQNDSNFLWVDITGAARDPAALQTAFPAPAVTLQVNDSGSGRNIFQQPVDWLGVVGTAELPGDYAYPYLAERGGSLTITYTQLAGQAYDIRLCLRGFKIFDWDEDINQ